jgi:AP-4 complex subunit mu-1
LNTILLFLFIRKSNRFNVSPASVIEFLNAKVFKDYCGVLTEESIRKNFILVYELIEEMIDFGFPQITSTEMLKNCVHNEAVMVAAPSLSSALMSSVNSKTKSSAASFECSYYLEKMLVVLVIKMKFMLILWND